MSYFHGAGHDDDPGIVHVERLATSIDARPPLRVRRLRDWLGDLAAILIIAGLILAALMVLE